MRNSRQSRGAVEQQDQPGTLATLRARAGAPAGAAGHEVVQGVLEALPDGVMLVDADHRVLAANAAAQELLGISPKQEDCSYCPARAHGLLAGCPLEDAIGSGGSVQREYRDASSGRVLSSHVYPTGLESASGLAVFVHTVRDVTDELAAQRRVERRHEAQQVVNDLLRISLRPVGLDRMLELVVERIVAIPWLATTPHGVIFLIDEASATLVMKAHKGLDARVERQCARVPLGKCLCGRAAATKEIVFADRVGVEHEHGGPDLVPHGHFCVPISHGGTVLGVLTAYVEEGHLRDEGELQFLSTVADVLAGIILRKRTEAARLKHERVSLTRERMARVGELYAGVAHTVRNPLHGVLSYLEILGRHTDRAEPAPADILGLMHDGLQRIEKVTRRLLSLTREVPPRRMPTEVSSLLADVVELMALNAEERDVELRLESNFHGEAMLDADSVMEGLSGLIANALDACSAGDIVTVRSGRCEEPEPCLELVVQDTGDGIAAEDLPRVLDPFYTTKAIGEGSGLGLAIMRRVVDEHGGDIHIESEPGQGTKVRLRLPYT